MLETQKSHLLSDEIITREIQKTIDGYVTQNSSSSLTKVIQYHFNSGGKKLRAKIAYLIAIEFKSSHKNAILWASICEVLHNASLIHDDLQDQDSYRRNQLSLWKKYDSHTAITAGDFLIFLSMQMVYDLEVNEPIKLKLMQLVTSTSIELANGQYNEKFLKLHSVEGLWDMYLQMVDQKTSALYELPLVGAGILALSDKARLKELKTLATDFGQLFQVQDDIIDLYGVKGRKQQGNDIKEGKLSALCATHVLLHPEDHQMMIDILNTQREQTSDETIIRLKEIFKQQGSLSKCLDFIQQKLNDIENNKLLTTNTKLSAYFQNIVNKLMQNFNEVDYE